MLDKLDRSNGNQTKICLVISNTNQNVHYISYATYLQKYKLSIEYGALVLKLLMKCTPNSTIRRSKSGTNLLKYDAKFALNTMKNKKSYISLNPIYLSIYC